MTIDLSSNSIVEASSEQLSSHVGEEAVVLNLRDSCYYGLDEVGARIWSLIQEPSRVSELRDAIMSEYNVDAETCERDLIELLGQLAEHGMVEVRPGREA